MSVSEKKRPVVEPAGRLEGKVALVTGANHGIGLAIAQAYAREGARLVLAARDGAALKEASKKTMALGAETFAAKVDLKTRKACDDLYTAALHAYGRVDVLVLNHAVLGPREMMVHYPISDWEEVMNTNLNSAFWLSRAALGTMIPNNAGSIIYVSSSVGREGKGRWGAYAVSKGGLEIMSQVIADEAKEYNVRSNTINPGATRTAMRAEAYPDEDPNTLPTPDTLMNAFIYLGSDISKGVTGQQFNAREWMGRSF